MKIFRISFFVLLLNVLCFAETDQEKGLRIASEAYFKNKGFNTQISSSELKIINAHGSSMTRRMYSTQMETKKDGDKMLIEFLWPADVKGTKLLTWSHKNRNDDQWLFLPALNRVKRILSTNQSGSFVGSEFSYEDVGSDEFEKYTYLFLRDDLLNNRPVFVYERYPINSKSGYSKQIVWMDKQYYQPLKIEYFDRKKELLKVSIFADFKLYDRFWLFHQVTVENVQNEIVYFNMERSYLK